jgi:hypothetical protein
MEYSTRGAGHNPHSEALHACVSEALSEAPGLAARWVARLADVLKQQGAWAANPREKAGLLNATQILTAKKHLFETQWPEHWRRAISESLQRRGDGQHVRRSLDNVNFDDLELMDETQILATVQAVKLENELQGAAGDALLELSALLSGAQGYAAVKVDSNPLRPETAISALREATASITSDKDARALWLQKGAPILSEELQVLYRHLIRLLQDRGVTRAGFAVVQSPGSLSPGKGVTTAVRLRPAGIADGQEAQAEPYQPGAPGAPTAVSVLKPFLGALPDASYQALLPAATSVNSMANPTAGSDPWNVLPSEGSSPVSGNGSVTAGISTAAGGRAADPPRQPAQSDAHSPASGYISSPQYTGPERRSRLVNGEAQRVQAFEHLKSLAGEVVRLMFDGILRNAHLLPPVRTMLQRLEPAMLRIAHQAPRLLTDRHSPARRLLDEVTRRSLAFEHVDSGGLSRFLTTLDEVAQLFLLDDVDVSILVDTALDALTTPDDAPSESGANEKARGFSVDTAGNAEQRLLLAEKVAQEVARHPDFAKAAPEVQAFAVGPWSQVIARARLEPAGHLQQGRLSADVRYFGVLSDLLWSSCVDASRRNRGRLVRLIPGLLRTLREGLQTIDCDTAASRQFFTTIMSLHEAGLKVDADRPQGDASKVLTLPPEPAPTVVKPHGDPGANTAEAVDAGFMAVPFPDLHSEDFADTQPMRYAGDAAPPVPTNVPELSVGTWLSLLDDNGQSQRLQLTWVSPHGSMYLLHDPQNHATSMTRRSFERRWHSHRISVVGDHSAVDDGLDRAHDMTAHSGAAEPIAPGQDTEYRDLLPPLG